MTLADRERWDAKYVAQAAPTELKPPGWLVKHAAALQLGRALDLACGHGHAAIWLAERGWDVTAIDISPQGLAAAKQWAESRQVHVNWIAADLDDVPLGDAAFDLITVFRFLDRNTLPARITAALRPGGRLLYETFLLTETPRRTPHVRNPTFLLRPEELPQLFRGLKVLDYVEHVTASEAVARLAAIKM
jgi:tellurite methyltransferase